LFDELSDTFYFGKNKPAKFVWGNRLLQGMRQAVCCQVARALNWWRWKRALADRATSPMQFRSVVESRQNIISVRSPPRAGAGRTAG
jgi:hypothetical protein